MNKEEYYELPLHEQNLIDRDMTQQEYDVLPDYERRLVDKGLPTLAETKRYRKAAGWVPYEDYMEKIYFHHPGRKFDDFNMREDHFDKQMEPDKLLREAAYLLGLKNKPTPEYTEEDQKEIEAELYLRFRHYMEEFGA